VKPNWRIALRPLTALGLVVALGFAVTACGGSSSSSSGTTGSGGSTSGSGGGEQTTAGSSESATEEITELKVGELNFDMKKYCGSKPTKVGLLDGFGSNTWRVQVRALDEKTIKECPNVTEVKYYNANLDPEKYNSTLSSWAAEGVNIINAYPDFGQASVPAFRAAQEAGAIVTTNNSIPGNATIPGDVTAAVEPNFEENSRQWVEFLDKATKGTAQIILMGGPVGNPFDQPSMEAMEKVIEETGAEVEFVDSESVDGNWEAGKTQQAMSSILSKYPNINGVAMSYVALAPSVVRAFEAAGKPLPAIAGQGSSNEDICMAEKLRKGSDPNFNLFAVGATGNASPLALAKGMAAFQEIEAPELGPTDEATLIKYPPYIDTLSGELPKCIPSLPPEADLSMALTQAEVEALVK
jgi:ribose transport system substrate-binding protein